MTSPLQGVVTPAQYLTDKAEDATVMKDIAVHVREFELVDDIDSTLAIQKAINFVGVGGTVVFERLKEYVVSGTIFAPVGITLEFNFCTITPVAGTYINGYVFSLNSANASTWDEIYPYKFSEIKHLNSDNSSLILNLKLFFVACPIRTEDIRSRRYYGTIISSGDYIDLFDINYVNIYDHMSSTVYAITKTGQGDGVHIRSVACANYLPEAFFKAVSVSSALGCIVEGCINGDHKYSNCEAVSLNNSHFERGTILIENSNVRINGGYYWKRVDSACIVVSDTQSTISGDISRPVTLNDVVFKLKYQMYDYAVDFEEIDISGYNGELTLNNCYREIESYGMPYAYAYNCGVALRTGVGTKILSNSNSLTVKRKVIKNDKIILGNSDDGYNYLSAASAYENSNLIFRGSLGTYFYKVASIFDTVRMLGIVNTGVEKSVVIASLASYGKIVLGPAILYLPMTRIYRGTTSGVYTKYVDIPYPMSRGLFDTGDDISGFTWKDNPSNIVDVLNPSRGYQFSGINIIADGAAIPTVGTWLKGDKVMNNNPATGGYQGWVCITAGTPGAWKGFGLIEV